MQIKKISTSCNVNEANGVAQDIIRAYDNAPQLASIPNLAAIMTMVRSDKAELNSAIEQQGAESDLGTKDRIRDDAYRALYGAVYGYQFNPDTRIKEAAVTILPVFDIYGLGFLNETYVIESSKISVVLQKLAEPSAAAAISMLPGVKVLLEELVREENLFEAARVAYNSTVAQEKTEASASDLKKRVVQTINTKLVSYLQGALVMEEHLYGDFARVIDSLIGVVNDAVKRRGNSKKPDNPIDPETPKAE